MADTRRGNGFATRLRDDHALRVALYYLALAGAVALLWRWDDSRRALLDTMPLGGELFTGNPSRNALAAEAAAEVAAAGPLRVAASTGMAIVAAVLLSLPVAWIYILTRQKKGYRQSVVQTLIVLPVVVAGIVVLVKNSLALAFSLAGIVAAVKFRNTLEDSKDAVYIFLATAIGLAAGVHLPVAVVISVAFNLVVYLLWRSDFGRSPGRLEGKEAQRRLERALSVASRTGTFVAKLDEEILKSMAPEQLDALADRAWRRRKKLAAAAGVTTTGESTAEHSTTDGLRLTPVGNVLVGQEGERGESERVSFEKLLRVHTQDIDAARATAEGMLPDHLKRWRFGGVVHEADGSHTLEYGVVLKKTTPPGLLLDELRRGKDIIGAELL
ncbi:MAG TPA: DUF4956 domain-containing protein [Gemmatimonadaceae bacterium]|nr:DUF4956 domain-containing protein [Gemmatimonadaceae bacterium]